MTEDTTPTDSLAFQLLSASNYIECLGGDSRSYRAALAAARASLAPSPAAGEAELPDGIVLAPHYRGYAHLGTGNYLIDHTQPGDAPELVISIATEADKAGRSVGEDRDNPPGKQIQPEDIAVRIRFESAAGLDALEKQLRYLREVHFADSIKPEPEPIGEVVIGEDGTVKGWTVVRWRKDLPPIAVGTKLYAAPPAPSQPAPAQAVPLDDEQMHEVLRTAGPELLDLARQWADNKIHVYQFTHQAERIVADAVERGRGITGEPKHG